MNLAVNHKDTTRHLVDFTFEREFDKSNLLSLLMPFVNDPISTRKGAFGKMKELDVHRLETSDFDLTPGKAMSKFDSEEESKDYSFFIDGESFIPERGEIFIKKSFLKTKHLFHSLEQMLLSFPKSFFRQLR